MSPYSLTDTFTIKGRFWLPAASPDEKAGEVSFSPDNGVTVELHGGLSEDESLDSAPWPVVFARTPNGFCSLFNVRPTNIRHSSHDAPESSYAADFLAFGDKVPETPICSESWFKCNHLQFFLAQRPFSFSPQKEGERIKGVTIAYQTPESIWYGIPDHQMQIGLSGTSRWAQDADSATLYHYPHVAIRPRDQHDFTWHLIALQRVCGLLSLLTDEIVVPTAAYVKEVGAAESSSFFYEYPLSPDNARRCPQPLFSFESVQGIFGEMLKLWFSTTPILQDVFDLFVAGHRIRNSTIQSRFLVLTQALEAFSRATSEATYMPESEYEPIRATLAMAIPDSVQSDHRASLKNKIRFGNEHSLRKRLTGLLGNLSQAAQAIVCSDPSAFIGGVIATRNYLTHYTEELRAEALFDDDLYWAGERLTLLLRVLLMKVLGIPEATICKRILTHHGLSQIVRRAKQHPESKVT